MAEGVTTMISTGATGSSGDSETRTEAVATVLTSAGAASRATGEGVSTGALWAHPRTTTARVAASIQRRLRSPKIGEGPPEHANSMQA